MSIQSKAASIIDNNWEEVKTEMRHTWRKLTEKDLKQINSYEDLVTKLKQVYDLTEEEVGNKINEFIDDLSLKPNLSRLQSFVETVFENVAEAKNKLDDKIKSSLSTVQEKTSDLQEDVTKYIKENPLKVLGLGVLAAVTIKELVTRTTTK